MAPSSRGWALLILGICIRWLGIPPVHRVAFHTYLSGISSPAFRFFGKVGAWFPLILLVMSFHSVESLSCRHSVLLLCSYACKPSLDQCCPHNAAFSAFACYAGFQNRVFHDMHLCGHLTKMCISASQLSCCLVVWSRPTLFVGKFGLSFWFLWP